MKKTIKDPPYDTQLFRYTLTTRRGIAERYVYRFLSKRYKTPVGIQFSTVKGNKIKISIGELNKDNVIIDDFDVLVEEVNDIFKTKLWAVEDFLDKHPEYRKYRII
mgnify:CR=1 FL=1